MNFKKITIQHWLILILLLSAFLRFYNFTSANVITDEVLTGLRSIGMIDFDAAQTQTSPWQWVEEVPAWMHLSMHDHPIFGFIIQNIFFTIFGNNLWGLRLPFILAGILSVYLVFLIGRKLFNEKIGLLSAFTLTICSYHVWISRIGLQESIVILMMLLTFYYFLKALENNKYNILWLFLLGLSIITKYTALILIPICFIIIIHQKKLKSFFVSKYFWLGILLFFIALSPSIIYNIKMQQTFGHLDFQLSALLKQHAPNWHVRLGREMIGDFNQKVLNLTAKLKQGLSWPGMVILVLSYFILIWRWLKTKKTSLFILTTSTTLWLLWYFIIGSTQRFMSYLMPFSALATGWLVYAIYQKIKTKKIKYPVYVLTALIICFELFFITNTLFTFRPLAQENIFWARTHYEIRDWGFNKLDKYLNNLLKNKMPAFYMPMRYGFLTKIKDKNLAKMKEKNTPMLPILIIYDSNIDDLAALWLFHRYSIYQTWPIIDAKIFFKVIDEGGENFYQQHGIENFYFISPTENTLLEHKIPLTDWGQRLEKSLIKNNAPVEQIKDKSGQVVFNIYKF